MNPLHKSAGHINEPIYHQHCSMCNSGRNLGYIKHHTYSTQYSLQDQLKHARTMFCHVIIFMIKGVVHLNWGEYKDVVVSAGEMYFLPRGAEISGYIEGDVSYIEVQIDREMEHKEIDDLRSMRECEDFNKFIFEPLEMRIPMQKFVESLEYYLVSGINCSHLMEAKLTELLVIFNRCYSLKENARFFYPMVESISEFREFIISNYKISSTIEELIEIAHMSRSTFDRKFKDTFGTTPRKWIEEHMLQTIINKASEPNVTVKDLMYEVEIYNPSQFTRLCKRLCGIAPSELIRHYSCNIKA